MSANPSPAVAAFLSFIFPGLGQIYAGQGRKGLFWAIPMFVFIIAVAWLLLAGKNSAIGLIRPEARLALLVFNVAFVLYHVAAMLDAYAVAQRTRYHGFGSSLSGAAPIMLAALVSLTLILHGVPEVIGIQIHNGLTAVAPGRTNVIPPPPSFTITTPGPQTPTPVPTPSPLSSETPGPSLTPGTSGPPSSVPPRTPLPSIPLDGWPAWSLDGRLNVLLVGSDSRSDAGVGDVSLRTDSMILLTEDIQSGKAALVSFPRNMCTVSDGSCGAPGTTRYPDWLKIPLAPEVLATPAGQAAFPSGSYGGINVGDNMLNALWKYAASHPDIFPGSEGISGGDCQLQFDCIRAWRALVGTVQEFTGQSVDGVVAVNLKGFVALVENLPGGGIWLDIPEALHDDAYFNSQQQLYPVDFQAGCQFLGPEDALAYARSRHQDSDYQRERRQQFVLAQIRKQLDPIGLLPHVSGLLQVAAQNIFMTFPDEDIQYLAQAASRVDADRLYRVDLAPAQVTQMGSMAGIRDAVTNVFDGPEPTPVPPSHGGGPCPPR